MYIQRSCCRVCHDNRDGHSNCELSEDYNEKTFAEANAEYQRLIYENLLVKNSFAKPITDRGGKHWRCSMCDRLRREGPA